VQAVSIVGTEHYGGITLLAAARPRGQGKTNLALPAPLQPARFRRWIESEILISLAGPAAALLLAPDFYTGYVPPEPDEQRAEALARLAVLSRGETERLERAAQAATPSDDDEAERLAGAFAGDRTAWAYLGWLRAEADELVKSVRFRRLVAALVPELLERRTISGRLARRVFVDTLEEANHVQ
jgi:hypothetical protein